MNRLVLLLAAISLATSGRAATCDDVPPKVEMLSVGQLDHLRAEYETGKRDDRDGYIILNQLKFDLSGRPELARPGEREEIAQKMAEILKKHPEFPKMNDWRLSDTIACENAVADSKQIAIKKALEWAPADDVAVQIFGNGTRAAVVYQFKIAFFDLPDGVEVRAKGWDGKLFRGETEINPATLTPKKVLTFQRLVNVPRTGPTTAYHNLLVCTSYRPSTYTPLSPEEQAAMRPLRKRFWINKSGQLTNFCGVISLTGEILAKFDTHGIRKGWVVNPVGIRPEGDVAAIVGGADSRNPEEEIPGPQELWIWRSPKTMMHKTYEIPKEFGELMRKVNDGTIGEDAP